MKRKVKSLLAVTVFIVFSAFLLLRFSSGLRSAIPPELQSLRLDDFLRISVGAIVGESEPDLDGDGKKDKVLLYPTPTRVFLTVKWGGGRGVEKISEVISEEHYTTAFVFVTDMDGDGREEVAAIILDAEGAKNLAIWKFDADVRKMQMVSKVPCMLVLEGRATQIFDVDSDGKKEIVSFRPIGSASRSKFGEIIFYSLDVEVVWMERGRLQRNRKQFAVHKFVRLLPSLVCRATAGGFMLPVDVFYKAKVMTVGNRHFYIAPFTASVQRLNLWEIVLARCIPEEDRRYAAIFEVKTVNPSSWQFVGKSILR